MLSPSCLKDKVSEFEEKGFTVLSQVIPHEKIDDIFTSLEHLMTQTMENKGINPHQYPGIDKKFLYLKEHAPILKSHAYDLMKKLDAVQYVANFPDVIQLLKHLANSPILVDNVLIRMDDFSNDRTRPMHQEGLGQISYKSFNLWVPLVDVNIDTGTMRYIPGTHKQGYVPHRFYEEFNNYHGICEEFIDESNQQFAILKKGDALIFHPCLFHGTAPMRIFKYMRWTLIGRYNSLFDVPYLKSESAPMHIPQTDEKIFKQI